MDREHERKVSKKYYDKNKERINELRRETEPKTRLRTTDEERKRYVDADMKAYYERMKEIEIEDEDRNKE